MRTEKINYIKRPRDEYAQLQRESRKAKSDFVKSLSENEDALRSSGFSSEDIAKMKKGQRPTGYQVHHKLPLDDGGDNSFENLVLIKNDPYHQSITGLQGELTGHLQPGQSAVVDWPMLDGSIYPPGG